MASRLICHVKEDVAGAARRFELVKQGIIMWHGVRGRDVNQGEVSVNSANSDGSSDVQEESKPKDHFNVRTARDGSIGIFFGDVVALLENQSAVFEPIEDIETSIENEYQKLVAAKEIDVFTNEEEAEEDHCYRCKFCHTYEDDCCKEAVAFCGYNPTYGEDADYERRKEALGCREFEEFRHENDDNVYKLYDVYEQAMLRGNLVTTKYVRKQLYKHYKMELYYAAGKINHTIKPPSKMERVYLCVKRWIKEVLPPPKKTVVVDTEFTMKSKKRVAKITDFFQPKKPSKQYKNLVSK